MIHERPPYSGKKPLTCTHTADECSPNTGYLSPESAHPVLGQPPRPAGALLAGLAGWPHRSRPYRAWPGGGLAGHRPPATGHRPPATGHRPPATGHRPPTIFRGLYAGNGLVDRTNLERSRVTPGMTNGPRATMIENGWNGMGGEKQSTCRLPHNRRSLLRAGQ